MLSCSDFTTWLDVNGTEVQPVTRLCGLSRPMRMQLPLPDTVDVSVMLPAAVVMATLRFLPESVALSDVTVEGSCFGSTSYFSRSALISARRHSHCAFVVMIVPSGIMNGLGSFMFFFMSPAAAMQPAKLFSPLETPPLLPPLPPVVLPLPAPPAVPTIPPDPFAPPAAIPAPPVLAPLPPEPVAPPEPPPTVPPELVTPLPPDDDFPPEPTTPPAPLAPPHDEEALTP